MNNRGVGMGALIGVILAVLLGFIFLKIGLQVIPHTPEGEKSFGTLKDKLASPPGESFPVELDLDQTMFLFFNEDTTHMSYFGLDGVLRRVDRPAQCAGSCVCYCANPTLGAQDTPVTCSAVFCKSQSYTFVDPASYEKGKDSLGNSGFIIQGTGQANIYLQLYTRTILLRCPKENCVDNKLHHVLDFDLLLKNALKNCQAKDNPSCRLVFEDFAKVIDSKDFTIHVQQEKDQSKLTLKNEDTELWNFMTSKGLCVKGEVNVDLPPFDIEYDSDTSQPIITHYGSLIGVNVEEDKVCLLYGKT